MPFPLRSEPLQIQCILGERAKDAMFSNVFLRGSARDAETSLSSPLSRGFRNVIPGDVFPRGPLTWTQTYGKYKLFATHNETLILFSSGSLLE